MSWYYGPDPDVVLEMQQYGIRSVIEQLGLEALDAPLNTRFRMADGYNAPLGTLLVYRNGVLQDTTAGDYVENDDRTVLFAANLLAPDRVLMLAVVPDRGDGGLVVVDRPPANVGLVYTMSQLYTAATELMVFVNGLLQIDGVHYVSGPPNQFTLLAPPAPPGVVVAVIITRGEEGLEWRETFPAIGVFPAFVPLVNTVDKDRHEVFVYINGQLQAENFDYELVSTGVNVTRVIPGANDIEVVAIKACHPSKWRS